LCLNAEAARKYGSKVDKDTLVIFDSTNIGEDIASPGRTVRIPITQAALGVGSKVVANSVALGAFNALTNTVARESLLKAIQARVPAKFADMNAKAFAAGESLAAALTTQSAVAAG
jgi:2-oxoglutarate ferredoxin oxidoreductase subunit gamma